MCTYIIMILIYCYHMYMYMYLQMYSDLLYIRYKVTIITLVLILTSIMISSCIFSLMCVCVGVCVVEDYATLSSLSRLPQPDSFLGIIESVYTLELSLDNFISEQ